ncbi:AzlD domain-containing protein [Jannaschia sp. S6380]|uniref:AzlD domain-containing protein n=1 Tax=Jannaschia sp. S6380 TaxID=2926408 RepID=UPI001FF5DD1B|nr:AzlD domain-containing protein [Jannaschia sp. S6380]MCK0167840.1 AzlD domain-containing protein [Jannaschia sp. S6380]
MSETAVWVVIVLLGAGTFALRFLFLGLVGNRAMPPWVLRHLRYTGVAVLPGLVAPLVVWPAAAGGVFDPVRLAAAAVALGIGAWRRDVIQAVVAGALAMLVLDWLI